jgi:hypothetical protein
MARLAEPAEDALQALSGRQELAILAPIPGQGQQPITDGSRRERLHVWTHDVAYTANVCELPEIVHM